MESNIDLNPDEIAMLKRVSLGEFRNVFTVPPGLSDLVTKGYVELIPVTVFPIIPPRSDYRLTTHGEKMLGIND